MDGVDNCRDGSHLSSLTFVFLNFDYLNEEGGHDIENSGDWQSPWVHSLEV